ncbi:DbpA RNA binding domain-containing protein [Vibrio chagasii]|nr:DbpA RNA binding domain-containing protein [Vibrio chagasii]
MGDILGALTGQGGIDGKSVGKINLFAMRAYVAVERSVSLKSTEDKIQIKVK